jgi:tetraacyldisaccharide 4'-kinase
VTTSDGFLGRAARAVWSGRGAWTVAARGALLVPAVLHRAAVALRNTAYDAALLPSRPLPAASIGVGNLTVGGTGKTPFCRYLATELERRGRRVGILLRGYGGDEVEEYRGALPAAIVVADADRHRGAGEAIRQGAEVLVLDDCLQRRDVRPDVVIAVVAGEASGGARWPLPAGPWREGLGALRRADAVVVTRKSAPLAQAVSLAGALGARTRGGVGLVVELLPAHLVPLAGGDALPADAVRGRAVVALCGIGAPEAFAAQLGALGATRVELLAHGDHHAYAAHDVAAARTAAGPDGMVVTTGKDAVKLRPMWPASAPRCWVATLDVRVADPSGFLARTLDRIAGARHNPQTAAATPPARPE